MSATRTLTIPPVAPSLPQPLPMTLVKKKADKVVLGWREWASLPELGIERIQVKMDTGARTSALHVDAFKLLNGQRGRARIWIPAGHGQGTVEAEVDVAGYSVVKTSTGDREKRPRVVTEIRIGDLRRRIEVTLSRREGMVHRMIVGRRALKGRAVVDPGKTFLATPRNGGAE